MSISELSSKLDSSIEKMRAAKVELSKAQEVVKAASEKYEAAVTEAQNARAELNNTLADSIPEFSNAGRVRSS